MKRIKIWWLAVAVLLIATGIYITRFQDTEGEIIVTEAYHQRDEACGASFRMWSVQKDGIRYGFDQVCFTEDDAVKYVSEFGQCINVIRKQMKSAGAFLQDIDLKNIELQVLVLNDISTISIPQTDDVLVLSKDELESGQYMFPFFLSVCHLDENSQNFGAYEYIFEIEYDNEKIKEYLSEEKNQQALDLFYPRRSEKYSDKEDVEMFEQILASLATEKIGEAGLGGYLAEPLSEDSANDWLAKMGIACKIDYDDWDDINQLEFRKDSKYDFNMKCGNVEYLVKNCESVFESVSDMKDFIVYEMKTRNAIGEILKDHNITSPMFDDAFRLNYEFRCDLPGEEGVWANYRKMKGEPKDIEDFDMSGFIDGFLVSYWDGDEMLQVPIMTEKIWQSDHVDQSACGAELNYWEAESFVTYLIGQSSFETTWNCMINDMDFGEVYGKTCNQLKKEWMQSLRASLSLREEE